MISGKAFSEVCHWVIDPRYPERPRFSFAKSKDKDLIFINGDYIDSFFESVPLVTNKRYYIIVHNSDRTFTQSKMDRFRRYIHHIYAINTDFTHPRLTTIPIGFVDSQLDFLSTFKPSCCERDIEIYINFKPQHNSEKRLACIAAFENNPNAVFRDRVSVSEYFNDLCRSKFVPCPEGTGIDTHRVYEAILCGAIPVVLRNSLSQMYEKLPVCIVNTWSDRFYVPSNTSFETNTNYYLHLQRNEKL